QGRDAVVDVFDRAGNPGWSCDGDVDVLGQRAAQGREERIASASRPGAGQLCLMQPGRPIVRQRLMAEQPSWCDDSGAFGLPRHVSILFGAWRIAMQTKLLPFAWIVVCVLSNAVATGAETPAPGKQVPMATTVR